MTHQINVIHSHSCWLPQTMTWLYNLTSNLPNEIENQIVCEYTENLDQFPTENLHVSGKKSMLSQILEWNLIKLHIKKEGDYAKFVYSVAMEKKGHILHSHFGNTGWSNIHISDKANIKHIVSFYGYDVNYLHTIDKQWFNRYQQLFDRVDKVVCLGPSMVQQIIKLGCPANKIVIHHLGINLEKIEFKPRVWKPGETLKILIAASFREKKGITYALEALGHIQRDVDFHVTIIGDATNDERSMREKRKIINTIEKYNLQPKITMMGFQPYSVLLTEAYDHHIFLSPSVTSTDGDSEGTPVTIMEMAATGMPIISTLHSDIPEIIINGKTGLLAEERDVNSLVQHLTYLINNYDKWCHMLEASRRHIKKEFDIVTQAEKLVMIYNETLSDDYNN